MRAAVGRASHKILNKFCAGRRICPDSEAIEDPRFRFSGIGTPFFAFVPEVGFEPTTLAGYVPETYAYASSATRAKLLRDKSAVPPYPRDFNPSKRLNLLEENLRLFQNAAPELIYNSRFLSSQLVLMEEGYSNNMHPPIP